MRHNSTATIVALLAVLAFVAVSATAAPKMTIEDSVFDFGYVPQNSEISHIFWLHSTGDDSLKILKVVPGWGCTKAPLERDVLAVGDSTALEIIFSTKMYKNRVVKRPRIKTNEGPPDKFVQIVTHVVDRPDSTYPVVISPYKLDLSQLGGKVRTDIEFDIKNVSAEELSLSLISSGSKYFRVELPEKIEAGKTAKGKVTLTTAGQQEAFEKSLTFELNDKEKSRFTVPVKRVLHPGAGGASTSHSRAP